MQYVGTYCRLITNRRPSRIFTSQVYLYCLHSCCPFYFSTTRMTAINVQAKTLTAYTQAFRCQKSNKLNEQYGPASAGAKYRKFRGTLIRLSKSLIKTNLFCPQTFILKTNASSFRMSALTKPSSRVYDVAKNRRTQERHTSQLVASMISYCERNTKDLADSL